MSIEFSEHAIEQIKARKIPKRIILETVKKPENKFKSFKMRRLRQRSFGSKMLEVVTVTEGPKITIITVYYL